MNEDCEIYIGNTLMNICDGSSGASIINQNWGNLDLDDQIVEQRNGWCPGLSCCPVNQELRRLEYGEKRRIKLSVFSYIFTPIALTVNIQGGKITAQRRRDGKWKRSKQRIKISSTGGVVRRFLSNCSVLGRINDFHSSHKNRKSRERTNTSAGTVTWAFSLVGMCTTGSVENTFSGGVCNTN